jgi:hypothetical protein
MSLCQAGQVLLTEEAFKIIRNRTNSETPKGTMFSCVGVYRFKGVSEPQVIYAVGSTVDSLQPPPSSEKVKRLGGPEKIKVRLRDRQIKDVLRWVYWKLAVASVFIWIGIFYFIVSYELLRFMLGLEWFSWVDSLNYYIPLIIEEAMRRCRIK